MDYQIIFYLLAFFQLYILVSSNHDACGPKGIDKKGVDEKEIKNILKFHNRYRLKIIRAKVKKQPKGVNLYRMKWDSTLAVQAQKHAEECIFAHDHPEDARFIVGQNIYIKYTPKPQKEIWSEAITSWYREHKQYTYGPVKPKQEGPMTGHYTQVIWSKTYLVGCGLARYFDKRHRSTQLYVCNYGPAGNMVGLPPYKTKGPNKCPNLCHPPEK